MIEYADKFEKLITQHRKITILSHVNPDADALGTALGLYAWFKERGFTVEVCNASEDIPIFLDFLPYFSKIKRKIDFKDSLIISCDCGSIDRLGFNVDTKNIINIDHHVTNSTFGILNVIDVNAVSSSEVAYKLIKHLYPVSKKSAIAFYTALVSDTRNFTTDNTKKTTFELASELIAYGVNISEVSHKMLHRRSLASLRILGIALSSLEIRENAQIALLKVTQKNLQDTGAKQSDLDGVVLCQVTYYRKNSTDIF